MNYSNILLYEWEHHCGSAEILRDDFIKAEMQNRRQELEELFTNAWGIAKKNNFLRVLSSAYSIDCEHAINIAKELNLNEMDFFAIEEDFSEYEKEYYKQFEL